MEGFFQTEETACTKNSRRYGRFQLLKLGQCDRITESNVKMMPDKAVNIDRGQVIQILECRGKDLGIYPGSKREVFKGITDSC